MTLSVAAFGAAWMEKQNLAKEDALDDLLFNEILWKAVKGLESPARASARRSSCRSKPVRRTMTTIELSAGAGVSAGRFRSGGLHRTVD